MRLSAAPAGVHDSERAKPGNALAAISGARLLVMLLLSCAGGQIQPGPKASSAPTTMRGAPAFNPDDSELLSGKPIEVTIPGGDTPKRALADFLVFCEENGLKCVHDEKDESGNQRRTNDAFGVCRPSENYTVTIVLKGGALEVHRVPEHPSLQAPHLTLQELLRVMMARPQLLVELREGRLRSPEAIGSVSMTWVPPEELRARPDFTVDPMQFAIDCATGDRVAKRVDAPRKLGDNGRFPTLLWDGKQYRVTHGSNCPPVLMMQ